MQHLLFQEGLQGKSEEKALKGDPTQVKRLAANGKAVEVFGSTKEGIL